MSTKGFLQKKLPPRVVRLLSRVKATVSDGYAVKTYSQEGEDMVLRRLFAGVERGFYIDIGAHHPKRFSNTYFFYKRGWRGINIEPNPDMIGLFQRYRPRDVNLGLGVSDRAGELKYFMFNEPALNSFDVNIARARESDERYRIIGSEPVKVDRLDSILEKYVSKGTEIDFMTIDVEGHDMAVLGSSDWGLHRPKCLLVEVLNSSISEVFESVAHQFLVGKDYVFFAKTVNTLFYLDDRREEKK